MKASAAAVNGALAAVGLVAAYLTWQRPKEAVSTENVTVLEATRATLGTIRYEDGTRILELFQDEADKALWLKTEVVASALTRLPSQYSTLSDGGMPEDGGLANLLPPDSGFMMTARELPPGPPPAPKVMKGNERADTLRLRFQPFEGIRALGKLSAEKQKELGLEGTTRKLTITVSGEPHVYAVSAPQPGMVGTYLREEKAGVVYLLSGSLISELEPSSQALVDRRLHTFRGPDFDEFVLGYDGTKHAFLQKDAEIPQTMKVAPKETPDKPDDLVRNWHDKVWNRLIVTEVLGKGELPKGGEPKVELRIDYLARGSGKGFIEMARSGGDLWARTENTASWVGLHTGTDDVIAEAKKFTGASKPP